MLFRKTRKHFQGNSNRNHQTAIKQHTIAASEMPKTALFSKTDGFATRSSCKIMSKTEVLKGNLSSRKKQRTIKELNLDLTPKMFENQIQRRLRRAYQSKNNILKAIYQWGFDDKGFITKEQLQSKIKQKIQVDLTDDQIAQLIANNSDFDGKSGKGIDIKGFINLIYGKSQGTVMNSSIFDPSKLNQTRNLRINNLREKVVKDQQIMEIQDLSDQQINNFIKKINHSISRVLKTSEDSISKEKIFEVIVQNGKFRKSEIQILNQMKTEINSEELVSEIKQHHNIDHILFDPLLRKTTIKYLKKPQFGTETANSMNFSQFTEKYNKQNRLSNGYLTQTREKCKQFSPKTMLNEFQQKTRFGATRFHAIDDMISDVCMRSQPRVICQKEKIDFQLKGQRQFLQKRYENKLEKIRLNREQQKQNIIKIDAVKQRVQAANMQKIRNENEAYNYVNFIKKKWA